MKFLLLTLICGGALFAQDVSRVVQVKNIHPDHTTAVLDVLSAGKVRWKVDGSLRIIAMSGPGDLVDAMEAAIKKLDVPHTPPPPRKNIEVTFHMLLASPQGDAAAIAPELTAVAQQLRSVFGLKAIRVLETAVLRGREGTGAQTNGIMASPAKVDAQATYNIRYQHSGIAATDKGIIINLGNLGFNAKIPLPVGGGNGLQGNTQIYDTSISTDVDVREGQKVVVGKSSVDSGSQSIFLVVSAKVVD